MGGASFRENPSPSFGPWSSPGSPALGVLFLHGFTSSPWTLRELAESAAAAGYCVDLPRLSGHDGSADSLDRLRWSVWEKQAIRRCLALRRRCARVVVVGLSMGGGLALSLAGRIPDLAGLVLVNPATYGGDPELQAGLRAMLRAGMSRLPPSAPDIADPGRALPPDEGTPIRPLLTILRGLDRLEIEEVRCPILLFSSRVDHVLDLEHGERLARLARAPLRRVWLERSWHVATLDHDRTQIEAETLDFLQGLGGGGRRYRLGPATSPHTAQLVVRALEAAGWTSTRGGDWTLHWGSDTPSEAVFRRLGAGRFVNHIPAIAAIGRKDTLAWALAMDRRGRPAVHPQTWVMPDDEAAFRAAAARSPGAVFIRKPPSSSNGRGIRLFSGASRVHLRPGAIVQRYLARPHLRGGFKYTLRCYVAITNRPVQGWFFDDGFVKFTSRPYTPGRLRDRVVHLTNPEVQARNPEVPTSANNLTHRAFRAQLRGEGIDDSRLFSRIRALAARVVEAGRPFFEAHADRLMPERCGVAFELIGLDVLVDSKLRPWLIECNVSPSLVVEAEASAPAAQEERALKERLVSELLRLSGVLDGEALGFSLL